MAGKELWIGALGGGMAGAVAAAAILTWNVSEPTWVQELQDRQDQLQTEMASLRRAAASQAAIDDLTGRVEAIGKDLVNKETLDRNISQLRSDLQTLEETYRAEVTSLRGARAKTAAATLAAREIGAAIETGRPFAEPLNRLRNVLDDDSIVAEFASSLNPLARGVQSIDELVSELDMIRVEALQTSSGNPGGWVNRTVENLRALIDVEGLPEFNGVDAVLRDARDKTRLDQLPAAIEDLEPYVEDVQALEGWLQKARDRLRAERLISAIDRHLDDRVSRQG